MASGETSFSKAANNRFISTSRLDVEALGFNPWFQFVMARSENPVMRVTVSCESLYLVSNSGSVRVPALGSRHLSCKVMVVGTREATVRSDLSNDRVRIFFMEPT
jgi:hypothetical protein